MNYWETSNGHMVMSRFVQLQEDRLKVEEERLKEQKRTNDLLEKLIGIVEAKLQAN